MNLLHIDIHSI